jgi:alkanesulfonate monooxygenase SsuD/methylene tetrahydromethanopterin reductase-like flavin-dependent oxidoreductase (luciferase family)
MNRRCERAGRKVRYALNPFVALGRDERDALDAAIERIFAYDPDPDTRKIEQRMLPATKLGCIGSAESVLRQLRRFEAIGIELVLCKIIPTVDNLRRIGEEIVAPMRARTTSPPPLQRASMTSGVDA